MTEKEFKELQFDIEIQKSEITILENKLSQSLHLIDQMTDCYFNGTHNSRISEVFDRAVGFSNENELYKL